MRPLLRHGVPRRARHSAAVCLLACAAMCGCGQSQEQQPEPEVIYTSLPVFALIVRGIAGDVYEVRSVLRPGQSPHSFEPRPSDVRRAARSRVLVYGAPNLDEWLVALQDVPRISLIDLIPDSLRLPPGSAEPNPHFWLDPLAVRSAAGPLAEALCDLDDVRCEIFRRRAGEFRRSIDSLHQILVARRPGRVGAGLVVSHPFLDYFSNRYGINGINITQGSGGLEPTPRELSSLIQAVAAGDFVAVVAEKGEPSPAAGTVAEATGLDLITIDPLGGTTGIESYVDVVSSCASAIMRARQ